MPELPEVETVCRGIKAELVGAPPISLVELFRKNLRVAIPPELKKNLIGKSIFDVRRRAKYILFDTGDISVISHLGMSGSWRFAKDTERLKHDHFRITFLDGRRLVFNDPRRFGLIEYEKYGEEHKSKWLKNLGIEPLSEGLTPDLLVKAAKGRTVNIKTFIMNQKYVVGVGNIYASEALFLAKIKPERMVSSLKLSDWTRLVCAIQKILISAIESGGTTLRDYRQATGELGGFQKKLYVYDRKMEACLVCKNKIQFKFIQSRSTYWCKKCQK